MSTQESLDRESEGVLRNAHPYGSEQTSTRISSATTRPCSCGMSSASTRRSLPLAAPTRWSQTRVHRARPGNDCRNHAECGITDFDTREARA